MNSAIEVAGLSKSFPRTAGYGDILTFWRRRSNAVLSGVDLSVGRGEVLGLLGPNGAGKTTLLKILCGLVLPDSGRVAVNGIEIASRPPSGRGRAMYVPAEERSLYWRLTARENLRFFAWMWNVPPSKTDHRVQEVLASVGLEEAADERVMKYSSGMRQRLCLARGLLPDPEILLLDEPTRSLDPVASRSMRTLIRDELVGAQGKTVVLATHDMEEARSLCDRVAIIHLGRIKACGSVDALTVTLGQKERFVITVSDCSRDHFERLQRLETVNSVTPLSSNGDRTVSIELMAEKGEGRIPDILQDLCGAGMRIVELSRVRASLADAVAAVVDGSH